MKRTIGYILLVEVLLLLTFLTGCIEDYGHEHRLAMLCDEHYHWNGCRDPECHYVEDRSAHDFDWKIITEPGHLTDGKREGVCKVCSYKKRETILREGHKFIFHERVEPTCTESGMISHYECTVCGKRFKDKYGWEPCDEGDVLLSSTSHSYSIEGVVLTMPDEDSAGSLKISCTKCKEPCSELEIPHYSSQRSFYRVNSSYATCTKKGKIVYTLSTDSINRLLKYAQISESLRNSIYDYMVKTGVFDTEFVVENDYAPHLYQISYVTKPTLDGEGKIRLDCKGCDGEFLPVLQGGDTVPSMRDESIYSFVNDSSSCSAAGVITYNVNASALRQLVIDNYGLSSSSDVIIGDETFSFNGQILDHKYEAVLAHPTATETGSVCVRCSACKSVLTKTSNEAFVIPTVDNTAYFTSVLTANCTQAGRRIYSYARDKIIDGFASATGVTDGVYIAQIRDLLTDIVYEVGSLGHDYSSGREVIVKLPTETAAGVVVFPCDRAGCEHHRELADGVSELTIPPLSAQSSSYRVKSNTATCSHAGVVSLAIADGWYESQLKFYMSDDEALIYLGTDELTPALQNFEIVGAFLSHSIKYTLTQDTMTMGCRYADCSSEPVVIVLPQRTSALYTKDDVASTCCEQGRCVYTLSYWSAYEIVSEYSDSIKTSYPNCTVSSVAEYLNTEYNHTITYELNSTNHPENMIVVDSTRKIEFPQYNPTLNTTTRGTLYKKCKGCGNSLYQYISYSDGVWSKTSLDGGFSRLYLIDNVKYYDTETYYWYYSVYYVGVPFIVNPTEISTKAKLSYEITLASCEEYNGMVAKEILVYIDGVLQIESNKRLTITASGVKVVFHDEYYRGDVFIKIIYG